jgi:pimeloyl-ACP methyl ester carboxylesterase
MFDRTSPWNRLSRALCLLCAAGCGGSQNVARKNDMASLTDSGYAPVNGLRMYYEIHGSGGMPLVLLHGGGSTIASSFGVILPFLAAHRRVIAVELQGHGRTSDREGPVSFAQDADDTAALLAYLHIDRADFLGFSNGGHDLIDLGIRHPDLVHKLVIAAAFYRRDGAVPGFFDGMDHATFDSMPAPLKDAFLRVTPDPNRLHAMHDKDLGRMVRFRDWSDEALRSIRAPVLLMTSDRDIVTPEHAVQMSHVLPNARLVILPGQHGEFLGEVCSARPGSRVPELTAALVAEYLDGP